MTNTNNPTVLITPLKPALIHGMAQKLPVLVRIQAPDPDPTQQKVRRPYHLSLVIDRSGSMSGEPLVEAVRCAKHIVDRLEPTDIASLVVFDDRVKTLTPAQPVGNRKALYAALAQIGPGGSTNLHGGWKTGAETLRRRPRRPPSPASSCCPTATPTSARPPTPPRSPPCAPRSPPTA